MRRAALIHNPCAGRGRKRLSAVEEALGRIGYETEVHVTSHPAHATELARQAARDGLEYVFALGGDGTLREIAAGLLGTDTILALLPAGTTNVVALELGLPLEAVRAVRSLENATVQSIDVGVCAGEPFLMQASAGFDARVMARVSPTLKRRLGKTAVAAAGVQELWRYQTPQIEFTINGSTRSASFLAACNLQLYAGGSRLAPAASLDSGRLHVVSFHGIGRRGVLSFAKSLLSGRHLERDDVASEDTASLEIVGDGRLDMQLDGDAFRFPLPIEIALAADKLSILRPSPPTP